MCYLQVIRAGFEPTTHSLEGCSMVLEHIANQWFVLLKFIVAQKLHT